MSFSRDYSLIDRFLHRLAFVHPMAQKVLGELENEVFRKHIRPGCSSKEVFVAGLPRSGTTLLLNSLYETGEFVTFTYRHMPFVLAPLLWNAISRRFHKPGQLKERAHGDGVGVSFDSPEAFEEVIWLSYLGERIVRESVLSPLLPNDLDDETAAAIRAPIEKLVSLDLAVNERGVPRRYLSKNNANISRFGVLERMFPTATILVPFRHPLDHVASLMTQHARFQREHERDRFSRRYMRALGHFEFGGNFKPIDFDGQLGAKEGALQVDVDFWLTYWAAAYRHVLNRRTASTYLIDFDALLRDGSTVLERMAVAVGVTDPRRLLACARRFRAPTTTRRELEGCRQENLAAALDLHRELQRHAL